MKNNIFFMSINFLNIWRIGSPKSWYGLVLSNKNGELIDCSAWCKKKFKNHTVLASVYFSSKFKFYDSILHTTFMPEESFIECAKYKKINHIVYYGRKESCEPSFCFKYQEDFSKVADLFGNSLNTV
jgi:hypothetical protein